MEATLQKIGLSKSQASVYLALLKLGKANVTQISQESGVHRTNVYSVLDSLKQIGLVTYFHENNAMMFKASDPENLLNWIKESERSAEELLPDLKKIQESVSESISVEIFKGEKGVKSAMRDILRTRKDVCGFGLTGQLRNKLPAFALQWINTSRKLGIKNKYIYVKGTEMTDEHYEVRVLPKEFNTPVGTQIYGDKVLITIWDPTLVAIMIKSKEVAENYRKHFNLLWRMAKPPQ